MCLNYKLNKFTMENTSDFTPQDSLALIGKYIANYKKNFKQSSYYFLLWGWMISLASISHFVILRVLLASKQYDMIGLYSWINWLFFPLMGFIITIYHVKKSQISPENYGHIDRFVRILWQVTSLAIIIEVFVCLKLNNFFFTPFILVVIGLATLVNGSVIKFRPLMIGGFLFFIFAVVSTFFTNEYQLLINAIALICGYLVPGYMLRVSKSEEHV